MQQTIEQKIEAKKEARFYEDIISSVEFWASIDDMTQKDVISFLEGQLKNHKRNVDRTNYLDTIERHNKKIQELEAILIILKEGNN